MTCKDCVHYEACKDMYDGYSCDFDDCNFAPGCIDVGLFKNKADFVEVKRGRWIEKEQGYTTNLGGKGKKPYRECSICGWDYPVITVEQHFKQYKYCPHCGADMKKEGADNDS